jgi:hypothetical protein
MLSVLILYSACDEMINERGADGGKRIGREYILPHFHVKIFLLGPKYQ